MNTPLQRPFGVSAACSGPEVQRPATSDESTTDRRSVVIVGRSQVIAAPRGRLFRRSLDTMIGAVIARRYRVTRALGSGGMGFVYEATDIQTGRVVAIKGLQAGAYDAARLKRFRREAATATAIRSPLVCHVDYIGVEQGAPFIVMERLRGETLRKRLADHGRLPAGEAVSIMCQILDALTAVHEAGVIHRDVKPSNIFLTSAPGETPSVKLIDFGLAKPMRPEERTDEDNPGFGEITAPDGVPGTLHYLAPEHLLGGEVDQRVDVYAAGIMLVELLTGRRAFPSGSCDQIIRAILLGPPVKPSELQPDLPPLFDDVLEMATAKSRERRFASAQAFKRALLAAWAAHTAAPESGVRPVMGYDYPHSDGAEDEVDDACPTLRPPPMACGASDAYEEDDRLTLRPAALPDDCTDCDGPAERRWR